jgi:hypothetical protein
MQASPLRWIAALTLLALPLPAAAAEPEAADRYPNLYEVRYMDLHAAEVLAWAQCPQKDRCRVQTVGDGQLNVLADASTHERIARAFAEQDAAPKSRVFQLVVLTANAKPGGVPDDLPPGPAKAVGDISKLLPYKSYKMLDSVLLSGSPNHPVEGRAVSPAGGSYRITLRFRAGGDEGQRLFVDSFGLRDDTPGANAHDLISTTFTMDAGETVVVGTSKAGSNQDALVVLLTALP